MMSLRFSIKRGDTGPAVRYEIRRAEVDLTDASVRFVVSDANGEAVPLFGSAGVESTSPRILRFEWADGDTAAVFASPGPWSAEFEVTLASGKIRTFPRVGAIDLAIGEDLG